MQEWPPCRLSLWSAQAGSQARPPWGPPSGAHPSPATPARPPQTPGLRPALDSTPSPPPSGPALGACEGQQRAGETFCWIGCVMIVTSDACPLKNVGCGAGDADATGADGSSGPAWTPWCGSARCREMSPGEVVGTPSWSAAHRFHGSDTRSARFARKSCL